MVLPAASPYHIVDKLVKIVVFSVDNVIVFMQHTACVILHARVCWLIRVLRHDTSVMCCSISSLVRLCVRRELF